MRVGRFEDFEAILVLWLGVKVRWIKVEWLRYLEGLVVFKQLPMPALR